MEFTSDLIESSRSKQTDVFIMDFYKAFVKVSHNRLLIKLDRYDIRDNTLLWIKAFLESSSNV